MSKNEEKHWDAIAANYNDEVLDVYRANRKSKLQHYLKKHSKGKQAIDFGCGTGNGFKFLSPLFKEILAIDISQNCLDVAKERGYSNITFQQADLTEETLEFPKTDVAVCCNVAILPDQKKNLTMIKNVRRSLRKKGTAFFVLPALESVLLSAKRLIDWYKEEGVALEDIPAEELNHFKSPFDVYKGLVTICGVPTKHYLQQEIHSIFQENKMSINKIERLEYDWETEFTSPPSWMKAPFPWDWLVQCRKE